MHLPICNKLRASLLSPYSHFLQWDFFLPQSLACIMPFHKLEKGTFSGGQFRKRHLPQGCPEASEQWLESTCTWHLGWVFVFGAQAIWLIRVIPFYIPTHSYSQTDLARWPPSAVEWGQKWCTRRWPTHLVCPEFSRFQHWKSHILGTPSDLGKQGYFVPLCKDVESCQECYRVGRAREDCSTQKQGLDILSRSRKEITFLQSCGWISSSFARDMNVSGHLERAETFLANTGWVGQVNKKN